jgi:hypothetical protein
MSAAACDDVNVNWPNVGLADVEMSWAVFTMPKAVVKLVELNSAIPSCDVEAF